MPRKFFAPVLLVGFAIFWTILTGVAGVNSLHSVSEALVVMLPPLIWGILVGFVEDEIY